MYLKLRYSRRDLYVQIVILLILTGGSWECGPGRKSGRVRRPRKMTPLVFKQHVPNVSENTLGASGPVEKPITRDSPEFKKLVVNYNTDILFKDEEGTGADRIMSQRCKDKLNTLAIAVMNRWPGVNLRVTEAWDEDRHHDRDPLHYEGRAVDITTSDRDRSKNGMLARLAVEAGFDWVYYESRTHIHASVKSDSSITIKTGGCFAPESRVRKSTGDVVRMSELSVGDQVLSMDAQGKLVYSEIYMFLDVDTRSRTSFITLKTDSGHDVTVTPSHILYFSDIPNSQPHEIKTTFASRIKIGQYLFTAENNATFSQSRVVAVTLKSQEGFFAPLTNDGTIVVNDVLASCYAFFGSPTIAHASFAPVRWYYNTWNYFRRKLSDETPTLGIDRGHPGGIHWYAEGLHTIGKAILSNSYWYTL